MSTNAKATLPDNKHSFQSLMFRQHHVYNDKYFQTGALPFPPMWPSAFITIRWSALGLATDCQSRSMRSKFPSAARTPVLDRAGPGDPSEANKDHNQRLSSSAFANPCFQALRTPFLEAVLRAARAICFGTSLLAAPPPGWRRDLQLAISGRSGLVGRRTSLIWRDHF